MHDSFTVLAKRPQAHPLFQQQPPNDELMMLPAADLAGNRRPVDVEASPFKTSQLYTPIPGTPVKQTLKGAYTPLAPRRLLTQPGPVSLSANCSPIPARKQQPSAIPSRLINGSSMQQQQQHNGGGHSSSSWGSAVEIRKPQFDLLS